MNKLQKAHKQLRGLIQWAGRALQGRTPRLQPIPVPTNNTRK